MVEREPQTQFIGTKTRAADNYFRNEN